MKTALIAGATGLIGRECLYRLLESPDYSKVTALVRRELIIRNPKLHQVVVDFSRLNEYAHELAADDVFCSLGTTIRDAVTRDRFYEVDCEYVDNLATLCLAKGAQQFLVVSAVGANPHATIFYNSVKGQMEKLVSAKKFRSVHIFRPSLLLGSRSRVRPGEAIAQGLMTLLSFIFIGPLAKYRPVEAASVARALIRMAAEATPGIHIYESDVIRRIGKG